MSIAVGTGLAIAGVASGVGGLAAAKMQTSAAKKAAQVQTQAAQHSQAYIQQGMSQLGALYAPYMNIGSQATNTLGRLLTPPAGSQYASPGPYMTSPGMTAPPGGTSVGTTQYGMPGGNYMQQPQPMPQRPPMAYPMGGSPYMQQPYGGGTFAQMQPPPPSAMQFGGGGIPIQPIQGGYQFPQGQ